MSDETAPDLTGINRLCPTCGGSGYAFRDRAGVERSGQVVSYGTRERCRTCDTHGWLPWLKTLSERLP